MVSSCHPPASRPAPPVHPRKGGRQIEKTHNTEGLGSENISMFFSNSIANRKGFLPRPALFRAWTSGAGREAGSWQQDAVETGITSVYCEPMGGHGDNYPATVTLEGNVSLHDTGYADSIIVYMTDIGTPVVHRRYYINQRQALETRPVNIAQPSIIYLGLPA